MMKYTVKYSTLFKKSYRKCMKRGCDEELFRTAITILAETGSLPKEYKPHPLKGNYKGCMCSLSYQKTIPKLHFSNMIYATTF